MANQLMFEVGIKSAQEQLEKIKQEFTKANGELQKLLTLKVSIEGVDTITKALGQIGDSDALRKLRNEVAALNREFSILSKGAGGSGDIAGRGIAADIERTSQSIDRYTSKIKQLTEERSRLIGGTRNSSYQNFTDEILRYEDSLEGARKKLAQLNEQKNQSVASEPLKKSTQDAQAFETALGRIETAISGLKSGMNVNLSGDFAKWAQEVQNVTASIRELVEQLQKMHTTTTAALQSTQQLNQVGQKGSLQNGLFDSQKFASLQEAIDKIIAEINRLQQAFTRLGENNSLSNLSTMINGLAVTLSSLSSAINLSPTSEYVKKLQTDFEAAQAKVQELTEKLTALAAAQNNVAETASKAGKSEKQIGDSQAALFNRYNKLLADIQNIKREIVEIQRGAGGGGPFGDKLGDYFSTLNRIRNLVREITSSPSVADAITKGMSSEQLAKLNSALAALKTNFKEVIADAKDFNKATDKGSSQAEARIRKLGMAFNELKNYMRQNGGSEEMKRLQTEIQGAIRKMRDLMNAGNFAGAINVYERLSGIIRQAATATKEFENSQHSLSSTISHTNSNLQGQSQILSDLKSMAMQYLSVWGAQSFINNIIELGGQLEQQRLSIGAILQDTAQANHLFSQIKDLAIKSPFGVQQLDAMTKQLSAYGFQYSELYDWTKRLADISAATGTSVDRLALALGHVRSEGALSGYTLRQFSMGNIPLLQKLSENLGKTKQEIRKMTRNKEIGYEDVLNVLKQLTDEGGMFFEAQETMAQALNAKFKNLRDSFQIMYSEMAEGAPGDFLKGLATTLTDLSRQWQILMPMVGAAGVMWAMNKASAALVNVELAKMATLTNANTLASSKYSVAQLRQIANWEKMPHAMVRARLALQGFRTSLLSLGKMVFSWPTAIFAAIEALTYMWAKQSRESEKAKEMTEALTNTALESQKNISKQLSDIDPYEKGMSDSAMKTGIDSMTESIKNYGVNAQAVLEKVYGKDAEGRVMSLAEKYQYLREELEKTEKVYKEMQRTSGGIEFGVEFTDGGWLDDDVQTDLTNYAEAVKEYENAFITMTANYATAVNNALEQVKKASPEFKRIADGLSSDAERVKWLYENQGEYGGIYNMFKGALHREDPNAGGGVLGTQLGDNLRSAEQEAMKELDQFLKGTEEWFKKFGYDFTENGKNLSEVQVGNLLRQSREWLEKHPEWQNIYDVIWDKLNKRWGLPIVPDVTEIEEELPQWLVDFQKELDKTGIKLTANMSMEQIVDEMKKAYDKAQTTINKLGPIAMQAKIDIKGLTDEYIENYKFLNPELYETLKELKKAQDSRSQVNTAAEKRGLKLEGMKKDGTHKAEKQNQESAKAVREQVRVIKEAADAFEYWREKVGDKGAWEHVQREFGDVLKKIGITAQNIWDVRSHLNRIPKSKEYKAITDKKVKTETDKEIAKVNDQFFRKDFEKNAKEFTSSMQMQIDDLTQKWEIFKSVVSATGDELLAQRLSGVTPGATPADLKRLNVSSATGVDIDFDKVLGMSDKEIDEYVTTLGLAEDRIDEIRLGLKDWKKAQKDVSKSDIESYARWLGSLVDIQSVRNRNEMEYQDIVRETNRLLAEGRITQEEAERRIRSAAITRDSKNSQATATYSMLYNNSLGMAQEELVNILAEEIESLNKQFEAGNISAADYADKISKINQIQREFDMQGFLGIKGGVGAFLGGGSEGLANYYRNRAEAARKRASGYRKGESPEEQDAADKAEQEAKHYESMYTSLIKVTDSAKKVATAFDTLKNGVGLLEDLFANMGNGSAAQAMGDAGDILGGMMSGASSLSALGPYGMAAGAGLGLVSGLFALHDKSIQREIDAIKDQIDATKENTEAIKRARERTLGYDMGVLRDRMSDMYQDTTRKRFSLFGGLIDETDEAKLAMKEYYSLNSRRSGYSAELENLRKEREYYMQIYNLESSKKNVSEEALREYKKQIAELDDQILYFVEDLANDLWGIDFKAWSEQISDALWTAFENGEDAVQAFHDTADDIIADVAKKMMNIHLIEPVFKTLEDRLFGELNSNGQRVGGVYNEQTGQFDETKTLEILGQFFGENGEFARVINSAEDFYDMTKRVTGFDFSGDSSSSMSAGIKGITEQTADLLASYVNATRASTATIEHLTAQYFPMYYAAMTSGNSSLANIENHTAAIMRSNDIVAEKITSLDNNIIGLKNKTWKVPMA